jgi:hypothetical protein
MTGTGLAAIGPAFMLVTERYAPSFSGKGAFPPVFRLSIAMGVVGGLGMVYQTSCSTSICGNHAEMNEEDAG